MEGFPLINEKLDAGIARRAEFGPIWLDLNTRTLRVAGSDIQEKLDPTQYQMLWLLLRAQGNVITEQEIIGFIYAEDKELPLSNVVNQRMFQLRDKLDQLTHGQVIIDVERGYGWSLKLKNG